MSSGLLVLGMHRSGTSALARVLQLCGADIGSRILGESAGNEGGHWEDAFAVELHERLLASRGTRWDEALGLPADWHADAAAGQARRDIGAYLSGNRARHPLWAVKDPRLSLFADLWIDAARDEGQSLGAVLVLRHPLEVAKSLAARDGIAPARGLVLWLEYTLAAVAALERVPNTLLTYGQLLEDWRACVERIRQLPGGAHLRVDDAAARQVEAFLDGKLRHHAEDDLAGLPQVVREVWTELSGLAAGGGLPPGAVDRLAGRIAPVRELVHPLLGEMRVTQRKLWERVGRAEAPVATIPAELKALAERVELGRSDLVSAISDDLRHMQDVAAQALQAAAAREQEAALARQLAPRMQQLEAGLAQLSQVQEQLQQSTERCAEAHVELAALRAEAVEAARQLDASRSRVLQLEHEATALRADSQMLEQVKRSRSWRLTRPLRVAFRLLTGRGDHEFAVARQSLRTLVARTPLLPRRAKASLIARTLRGAPAGHPAQLPGAGMAALVALAPAQAGLADVFDWSVIDWHFRIQRPQHLARALAGRGHRVFYVSNNFVDAPEPGFRIEPLDDCGRLFQVNLHLSGAPSIYVGLPDDAQVAALQRSLGKLLGWTGTQASLSIVQHPYWSRLARVVPNARVVYDCMDHHGGFENNAPAVLEAERSLLADADLVTVTSSWLERELAPRARDVAVIRNAGEYEFFSQAPGKVFRDEQGRKVIGYFGAIAEWFDLDLVRRVAQENPGALVVLVGNDTVDARSRLAGLDNVRLVGERPYADLPYWLHGFDVALLPFRIIDLTIATNPVKVYEYLAAGKPVVAVDLPEMAQFDGLVHVARDADDFSAAVARVLAEGDTAQARAARQAFAAGQTWDHRARALDEAIAGIREPLVSVVVLAYNNLAFTQNCLFSIEQYSDYANLEVIVVDNASTDGSPEWLRQWAAEPSAAGHRRRLVLNGQNLGFAAGNNAGLAAAQGDYLVLLNNDTYVTFGWVRGLCAHLRRDPALGLVGPVTNNIGNEAKLDLHYQDIVDMHRLAGEYTRAHPGQLFRMPTVAFFCAAMPRAVYAAVGGLDEAFGIGFFEDDDYCRRVADAGWHVGCADDVFVHHHLSASFDKLKTEARQALFEKNKAIYEAKWGPWVPHVYRNDPR
ncbi:MAG: glycosyltransferase [Lysobacteraceae bacterium]|nr:MAG: glycosyltransferase [Xanthomonadaceae bacterium]